MSDTQSSGARGGCSRRGTVHWANVAGAISGMAAREGGADGRTGQPAMGLTGDRLRALLRTILRIRWYESRLADKMIGDPGCRAHTHACAGQEAVATGVCAALRNAGPLERIDLVYTAHRNSGHALAKGVDMKKMQAGMGFRAIGGSAVETHFADASVGFMGAVGMIGPGHMIAMGSTFASRSDRVAVVFGGGSSATPHFHAVMNNVRLLDLPVIYVLENSLCRQSAHDSPHGDIAKAARAYGIHARVVDGQDVFQVYAAAKEAVDRARAGAGPCFIEARTCRPSQDWRDPVEIARRRLIDWGVLTPDAADALEAEVKAEVAEAFAWAAERPLRPPRDGLKRALATEGVLPRHLA